MWRVLGKIGTFIRGAVPLIKEGVFSSIAENRVWITLYITITGLFLMSQSILQSTPLYIQVFAILLLIIALGTIYWLHRSPSLPQVFALCIITGFQPVVLITVSQFTIFDILIGPVVTWLIAIALAMSFTIIGRAFSFNRDLLPSINLAQKRVLNIFAAAIILFTGISLLVFLPKPDRFINAITEIQEKTEITNRDQLLQMTKKFAEDFPHNPGYWGTSAFGSFSWKNTGSPGIPVVTGQSSLSRRAKASEILG